MTAPRAEGTALERAMEWTDEQAADATIEVLSEDFEVTVLRSWFKPDPNQTKPGMSEWVSRHDHAKGMLQVGRALLGLKAALRSRDADIAAAVSAENEACAALVAGWDADTIGQVVKRDEMAAAIRARREGGSDATGE